MAEQQNGILSFLNSPIGQGILSGVATGLAGGGRTAQGNVGRGLLGALSGYNGAQDNQLQAEQRAYQQEQIAKQRKIDALAPQFYRSPTQSALAAGGGPTNKAASLLPTAQPSFDTDGYSKAVMGIDAMRGIQLQASLAKDTLFNKVDAEKFTPESVAKFARSRNYGDLVPARKLDIAPNGQVVDLWSARPGQSFSDPNKPFAVGPDGKQVANLPYQQYEIGKARAGASQNNVSVNTGQKGLDNEFKLRSEFKGEPVYKAHQEMQSAYSQIQQSLKQGTPAGDLAGATKIMKLLDPGSVVRESELGMAMAATGLMDRLSNYGNLVLTGQKLTPTQRKEFQTLADALYGESVKQFNSKRTEYQRLGSDYGLDSSRALGPDASMPEPDQNGWSIKPKGQQ